MTDLRFSSNFLAATLLALLFTSVASATNTRSWVSRNGLDGNTCTETDPCATFAGALPKTTAGGEINCINAGEFGNGSVLAIHKAITIDCGGTFGSILGPSGDNAIHIGAGPSDVVTLRNLSISSVSGGLDGILYDAGKAVHVENVRISGSGFSICLESATGAAALLTVDNATISDCSKGIFAATTSGTAVVNINNTRITNTVDGVDADNGSRVTIRDSTIYFNTFGVLQTNSFGSNLGSTVTVINSTLGYSAPAALQSLGGEFILAFGNSFVNDALVFNPNGGTIFTGSDNNNSGSAAGTANGGSVPKI